MVYLTVDKVGKILLGHNILSSINVAVHVNKVNKK